VALDKSAGHLFGVGQKAMRARSRRYVTTVLLIGNGERREAVEAEGTLRRGQLWIETNPLVKHEALPLIMLAATFFKVFEDAAI
jgi:hypothetical protein